MGAAARRANCVYHGGDNFKTCFIAYRRKTLSQELEVIL
jgi:hypothetical protein